MPSAQHAIDPQAVQIHLSVLQNVIARMASNSAATKAWCITLVSAILVVIIERDRSGFLWLTLIPTLLFFALDAYYLALEKGFRCSYTRFVEQLHGSKLQEEDLYSVAPSGSFWRHFVAAIVSPSVWAIYVMLIIMTFFAMRIL